MITNQKQLYDQECKNLIAKRPIIALLCKHTLVELKDYSVEEVQALFKEVDTGENRELENRELDYKNTITLHNGQKLIINVELQNDDYPGYDLSNRALFYSSLLITTQLGNEFTGSDYNDIKKVYSIWIMPHSAKEKDGLITETKLVTKPLITGRRLISLDKQTIIMIYINDEHDIHHPYKRYDKLLTPLLLFTGRYTDNEEFIKLLEEKYKVKGLKKEVREMCNLSEGIERRGRQNEQLNNLKNLMKNLNCSLEEAMRLLGIDASKKEQILKLL